MTEVEAALARIRRFFTMHPDYPVGRFASEAKLHRNTLYGLHDSKWNPSAETLQKCLQRITEIERQGVAKRGKKNPREAAA
jgi:hypothetical protein